MHSWISPKLVAMLGEVIDTAIAMAGADFGNMQLLDGEGRLRIVAQRNSPEWWISYWESMSQGQGACGMALAQSRRVLVEDVEHSPIYAGTVGLEIQRRAGMRAVHSIPLIDKQGRCTGTLSLHYRQPHVPTAEAIRVLDLLATHATALVDHARDEQMVRESETGLNRALVQLGALAAGADALIATVDREFRYTYFNRRHHEELKRLTGKDTVLNMSIVEVLSEMPQEREKALALWQRALHGEAIEQEISFGDPERYCRWYNTRHIPIQDERGNIIGAGEITADITDRKQVELKLRLQEAELIAQRMLMSSIMQATDVMLVLLDAAFNLVWANESYAVASGMPIDELIGRSFFDLHLHPGDERFFRQVRDEGIGLFRKDYPFDTPDQPARGTTYWDWSLAPVKDGAGKIINLVYSLRETTPYKQTELALARSEQRYRSLAEQVPDGIFVADPSGRYTDVNQVGAAMLGYSRDEIIGLTIADIIFPEEVRRLPEEIARFDGGMVVCSEWRFRRKDGSGFFGEVHGRRLPDGHLQGVLRDVSERRQREDERLMALTRQRDALVREVHHRIKNHLHGVTGLLSAEAAAHPALAAPLTEVAAQIRAIATVYGLQASRQAGQIELGQMVDLLVKSLEGPVSIDYGPSKAPAIYVSETVSVPVALVINELIVNALKHLKSPDSRRPVKVGLEQIGAAVRLEVSGGPAYLPDGFDFERQKKTGLGLELVGTLLPRPGSRLSYEQRQDNVSAFLWLETPVIRLL